MYQWPHTMKKLCAMPTYNLMQLLDHLTDIYIQRVSKCLDKLQEFPTTKHRKNVHINVYLQHLVFQVQPNMLTSVFYIFICGDTCVLSCNSKWTGTSSTHFWALSNNIQLPCDLWKGGTVHGQMCPYVHWIRCRTFSAFVVKCDLINNINSTVIKLRTWMANVSCQL